MAAIDPDQLAALESSLEDFSSKLEDTLFDILDGAWDNYAALEVAAPDAAYVGEDRNPYYEEDWEFGGLADPDYYSYTSYRGDVDELISLLYNFYDDADPNRFDTINQQLRDVYDLLEQAIEFDGGMNGVSIALAGWTGGAASNFRDAVMRPFGARLLRQVSLAKELAGAALSYKTILLCARADALDLAEQLRNKVSLSGEGASLSLGSALAIVGAVASGIGLLAGGPVAWPALVAWGANAARTTYSVIEEVSEEEVAEGYALNGIERNADGGDSESRDIRGGWAAAVIPSAREKINRVLELAAEEERKLRDGMRADVAEIEGDDERPLEFAEPELTTTDTLAGLGVPPDLTINDIVALKKVGALDLPAIAYILHRAHAKVATVRLAFDSGISNCTYIGTYRRYFDDLVDMLDAALTRTRDYLYESGQNLVAIADGYYASEEESRLALESQLAAEGITLAEHLASADYPGYVTPANISFDDLYQEEIEDFEHDVYRPDPAPVRPGHVY